MPILVDGDNLLGTWRGRRRTDGAKHELLAEIRRWAGRRRRRVVVAFDGGNVRGADVVLPPRGRTADDAILAYLEGCRDPAGWTVVTSDRSLGDRCRWIGAKVERSDRFRKALEATDPKAGDGPDTKPSGPVDVDEWMRYFEDGRPSDS